MPLRQLQHQLHGILATPVHSYKVNTHIEEWKSAAKNIRVQNSKEDCKQHSRFGNLSNIKSRVKALPNAIQYCKDDELTTLSQYAEKNWLHLEKVPENALTTKVNVAGNLKGWSAEIANKSSPGMRIK